MQLLRVASTMSYQGSPYSGQGDEYDFEDDGYDDLEEYRIQEEPLPPPSLMDDSDEDTEEASETDIPNDNEPLEVKEQMYQDKLANLKKQLQQLEDGIHPEFLRRVKRLEHQLHERLRLNRIHKDHMYDVVEREYISEKKAAAKEFEEKKVELRENLLNDFEDKRKMIESERHSMELNGDCTEVKPVMKRILRRRANEPAPAPEKRRKPLTTTLTFQLEEREIEADLRAISRSSPPPPPPPAPPLPLPRHHATHNSTHPRKHLNSTSDSPVRESTDVTDTRVEDGKLLYDRRWYHRGQSVYVEGRELARFPGQIHAITDEARGYLPRGPGGETQTSSPSRSGRSHSYTGITSFDGGKGRTNSSPSARPQDMGKEDKSRPNKDLHLAVGAG